MVYVWLLMVKMTYLREIDVYHLSIPKYYSILLYGKRISGNVVTF